MAWPPYTLYFNGAKLDHEMRVSSVPFAGGISYRLDAMPAFEQKYDCTRCGGSGYEPAVGDEPKPLLKEQTDEGFLNLIESLGEWAAEAQSRQLTAAEQKLFDAAVAINEFAK